MDMSTANRQVGSVTIVDISGRIVIARKAPHSASWCDLIGRGHKQILLNLADVSCIDSAGFAHLIGSLTTVRKRHGELKLVNPTEKGAGRYALFKIVHRFDVRENETAAVKSFGESANAIA